MNKVKKDTLSLGGLTKKLAELKSSLFFLRMNSSTNQVKDISIFKKTKKDIARVKTEISKFLRGGK